MSTHSARAKRPRASSGACPATAAAIAPGRSGRTNRRSGASPGGSVRVVGEVVGELPVPGEDVVRQPDDVLFLGQVELRGEVTRPPPSFTSRRSVAVGRTRIDLGLNCHGPHGATDVACVSRRSHVHDRWGRRDAPASAGSHQALHFLVVGSGQCRIPVGEERSGGPSWRSPRATRPNVDDEEAGRAARETPVGPAGRDARPASTRPTSPGITSSVRWRPSALTCRTTTTQSRPDTIRTACRTAPAPCAACTCASRDPAVPKRTDRRRRSADEDDRRRLRLGTLAQRVVVRGHQVLQERDPKTTRVATVDAP